MKVTRVVLTLMTYQHLCRNPLTYTTCPAWNMHPSIWHTLHFTPQWTVVHHAPLPDQYATIYHLPLTIQKMTRIQTAHQNTQMKKKISQTVHLDDKHWMAEIVPERTFCIHENGLPNNICQHPCPYGNSDTVSYMDSLDLSDISDYEDYMMTTSEDEELPGLEEVPYWHLNSGLLEHLLNIQTIIFISCA